MAKDLQVINTSKVHKTADTCKTCVEGHLLSSEAFIAFHAEDTGILLRSSGVDVVDYMLCRDILIAKIIEAMDKVTPEELMEIEEIYNEMRLEKREKNTSTSTK